MFHYPFWLPAYLNTEQVYVATFSILFARQVLILCRLPCASTLANVKKSVGGDINNNRGVPHGGYTISGRGASQNWKTENPVMFGGKDSSNSIIHTIEYILKAIKQRIPEY